MKKRFSILAAFLLSLTMLATACSTQAQNGTSPWRNRQLQRTLSQTLAIDLSGSTVTAHVDTHGGFHGDGTSWAQLSFEADSTPEAQISQSDLWHALPLSDTLHTVLYGETHTENGMMYSREALAASENGTPLFPTVENGYYFFADRSKDAVDPQDPSDLFSRASYNFTIALYDVDTAQLYYFELDT